MATQTLYGYLFLVGAFSLKEKSPTLTVSSFFNFFFSLQSHSEWSTFLQSFVPLFSEKLSFSQLIF